MKSFIPLRLNSPSSGVSWVAGLILTQLLFASVCAQSSSLVCHGKGSTGLQDAESGSLPKHCNPITFIARGTPPLSLANWISKTGGGSVERTVHQVVVDIDHDGDPDLIAVTNLPRLLVWLNDGRGGFTSWDYSYFLRSSNVLEDAEDSNYEDTPFSLLWLEARPHSLELIPVASAKFDFQPGSPSFFCRSQSSPRAPPSRLS
jgi:hypothetical protein